MAQVLEQAGPTRSGSRDGLSPLSVVVAVAFVATFLFAIVSPTFGPRPAAAQEEWQLELVGQVGGGPRAVAVRDGLAYLGIGPRMVVVDVSDPTTPAAVGQTEVLPGLVEGIALDGEYAYAATGYDGLRVLDVSRPTMPLPVAYVRTGGQAMDVAVDDGFAFVATFTGAVRVIDVRDPLAPESIDDIVPSGVARAVHLDSHTLYIGHSEGLSVVNVRLPDASHFESELPIGDVVSVHAQGALVAAVTAEPGNHSLHMVDAGDPAAATIASSLDLASMPGDVFLVDDVAHVAVISHGLLLVDAADPHQLSEIGMIEIQEGATRVRVVADHAFAARQVGGLVVARVADPAAPAVVGEYVAPGELATVHAQPGTGYVFGLGPRVEALWGIDARSPESDLPLPSWAVESHENANELYAARDRLYAAGTMTDIVDVAEPETPSRLGRWQGPSRSMATIHASSDLAFVTAVNSVNPFGSTFYVLDVADPGQPVELGRLLLPGLAWRTVPLGSHVYVAAGDGGLRVVDVGDPTQPTEVGSINTLSAFDVAAHDGRLVVLAHEIGLIVYDLSDPVSPSELGRVALGRQSRLDVDGRFAFTSGDFDYLREGLTAIDLADPAAPKVVDQIMVPGYAYGVRAVDGQVYLASYNGGLSVLRLRPVGPAVDTATPTATPGPTPTPTPEAPEQRLYLPSLVR